MTPSPPLTRQPPSLEEVDLNARALRDKADEYRAWLRSLPRGRLRWALGEAARALDGAAEELHAALHELLRGREAA